MSPSAPSLPDDCRNEKQTYLEVFSHATAGASVS